MPCAIFDAHVFIRNIGALAGIPLMLSVLKRILSARALAAVISLVANVVAVYLLPGTEYAAASVAISVAAIASPLFYQPFSKYVLISGRWRDVESTFWAVQPLVAVLLLGAAYAWWAVGHAVTPGLAAAAAVFALSQGWKEFCGELARSRRDIDGMQRLYVMDAITTTVAAVVTLFMFKRAEAFLLSSAISSILWSWRLMPRPFAPRARLDMAQLLSIYRYSYGLVGTSSLNAATIAIARNAVMQASQPGMSGAIQFVLDMMQKPMALVGSSATTAALPEARERPIEAVLPQLAGIMTAAFVCLALLACLVTLLPSGFVRGSTALGIHLLLACALFIWANRYKSSVMDIPLVASPKHVSRLVFGGASSLLLMWILARAGLSPTQMLVGAAAVLFSGGVMSLLAARRAELVKVSGVLQACVAPVLAIALAALVMK